MTAPTPQPSAAAPSAAPHTAPPRTVAHLIKGLGRGGAEVLLHQTLAESGDGRRFVVGYFLPHKDALVADLEGLEVPVRCFPASSTLRMLAQVGRVSRWLRDERVELLHCHLPLAAVVGRLAARRAGVPVVYSEHNLWERYHPLTRWLNRLTWRLQDHVVAVSAENAASIGRHVGGRVPVTVVRNGIVVSGRQPPDAATRAAARRRCGIPEEAPVVGTVAVFRRQKRLERWLEVASRVRAAEPAAHFLLAGDGPLRPQLEALAGQLGIADRVCWTGLLADVGPALAAMDVFLVTSEYEGLPLAVLEAMAAEVPVVATDRGGLPEMVASDTGLLLGFGDLDGLADGCLRLLRDPAARAAMGSAARLRVERHFSIARVARELAALYEGVVRRRRGSG